MDGFIRMITDVAVAAGITPNDINYKRLIDLPGYFRATKKWDIVIVSHGKLLAAIEAKSHVGESFGNNCNNRTEEAIGSAHDLWTAFREGKFGDSQIPWLGYLFLIEDCPISQRPVKLEQSHFTVFPEFVGSSYSKRYELLCQRLVKERLYTCAAFLASNKIEGLNGDYFEPNESLSIDIFIKSLYGHLLGSIG